MTPSCLHGAFWKTILANANACSPCGEHEQSQDLKTKKVQYPTHVCKHNRKLHWGGSLMVEQSQVSEAHCHAVGVASLDYLVICHRATWLCDELDTQFRSMVDGVAEGEEGI